MNCETCRDLMLMYLKGELDGIQEQQFSAHTAKCPACADELRGARSVLGLVEAADAPPIWRMLNAVIDRAVKDNASDIHIGPLGDVLATHYRIDGVLREVMRVPMYVHAPLVARIKLLAGMNPTETRLPQDGRVHVEREGLKLDLRVSCLPAVSGEKVTMRMLKWQLDQALLSLEDIGLRGPRLELFRGTLRKPYGVFLITGPVGSGRTTTCYSALQDVKHEGISIMTAEQPVIVPLDGITQVDVSPRTGMDFADAVRTILTHDPDVIFCGDLPDPDTARMCFEAALTGHLVIASTYAQGEHHALRRLLELGIDPCLIRDGLLASSCQRLFRRLCPACKAERKMAPEEAEWLRANGVQELPEHLWEAPGCDECKGSAVKGRVAAYAIQPISSAFKTCITDAVTLPDVPPDGWPGLLPMAEDAARRVAEGAVAIEEARRVLE